MTTQLYKYIKNHQILRFKLVNFIICKLYINKAIKIFKKWLYIVWFFTSKHHTYTFIMTNKLSSL